MHICALGTSHDPLPPHPMQTQHSIIMLSSTLLVPHSNHLYQCHQRCAISATSRRNLRQFEMRISRCWELSPKTLLFLLPKPPLTMASSWPTKVFELPTHTLHTSYCVLTPNWWGYPSLSTKMQHHEIIHI